MLPLPAPLAAGADIATPGAVRCIPLLVPATTEHHEVIAPFGIKPVMYNATSGNLEPAPTAAALPGDSAAVADAKYALKPFPGVGAAAVAVNMDMVLSPTDTKHVERSKRLTFAIHAYMRVRELLVSMPDDDEMMQMMLEQEKEEDAEAKTRAAEGGALANAGLGKSSAEAEDAAGAVKAAETDAAVADKVDEVRRGRARTEAILRRNDACRSVTLLLERAMQQAAQVAPPTHWIFYLLHSARAVALERYVPNNSKGNTKMHQDHSHIFIKTCICAHFLILFLFSLDFSTSLFLFHNDLVHTAWACTWPG